MKYYLHGGRSDELWVFMVSLAQTHTGNIWRSNAKADTLANINMSMYRAERACTLYAHTLIYEWTNRRRQTHLDSLLKWRAGRDKWQVPFLRKGAGKGLHTVGPSACLRLLLASLPIITINNYWNLNADLCRISFTISDFLLPHCSKENLDSIPALANNPIKKQIIDAFFDKRWVQPRGRRYKVHFVSAVAVLDLSVFSPHNFCYTS